MPKNTYPNQRTIKIHREAAKSDFLGIKNDNWQAAARDLGAHALMLYMYLASNADGYELALSAVAVRDAVGMPRSTFHDQFHKLVNKGYLVLNHGNTFNFYEKPQIVQRKNQELSAVQDIYEYTDDDKGFPSVVNVISAKETEINNSENLINSSIINNGLTTEDNAFYPKGEASKPTPSPTEKEFEF